MMRKGTMPSSAIQGVSNTAAHTCIAFEAFKLANYYMFGNPATIVTGTEELPPVKIDISAIPFKRERVSS